MHILSASAEAALDVLNTPGAAATLMPACCRNGYRAVESSGQMQHSAAEQLPPNVACRNAQGMLRGDFGEGDTVIVSAPGGTEADGLRLEVSPFSAPVSGVRLHQGCDEVRVGIGTGCLLICHGRSRMSPPTQSCAWSTISRVWSYWRPVEPALLKINPSRQGQGGASSIRLAPPPGLCVWIPACPTNAYSACT